MFKFIIVKGGLAFFIEFSFLRKKSYYEFLLNQNYILKSYYLFKNYSSFSEKNVKNFPVVDKIESRKVDYLKDEVATRLVERLMFIRKKFKTVLDLGSGSGHIVSCLFKTKNKYEYSFLEKIERMIMADISDEILNRDDFSEIPGFLLEKVCIDKEIPSFPENSMDVVITNLYMHWINNLPGFLKQIWRILVPDGVFLGSMVGGDSLFELRTSIQLAEQERKGGIGTRVSPMTDVQNIGSLLNEAEFKLITIDVEDIIIDYPDMISLMKDLQKMGENNAIITRPHVISRDVLFAAEAIYKELYGNSNGTLPCTFCIIYMIAWKPSLNQPLPLERGSGKINLKDVF
ncbi:unnamed protein product [Pneumocystis jirovecii]|uniref:Methyltransferase type 11 domain-containing protein n=1 Tax=Pneumocystis jirovecii TaxID=42068 RepID=L0P9L7_PNEJI|nr:unnamed protein product [Pneumocystis jirovecii]